MGRTVRPALTQRRATSLACPDVGIFDETRGAPPRRMTHSTQPRISMQMCGPPIVACHGVHREDGVPVAWWPGGMVLPSVEPSGVVSLFIVP